MRRVPLLVAVMGCLAYACTNSATSRPELEPSAPGPSRTVATSTVATRVTTAPLSSQSVVDAACQGRLRLQATGVLPTDLNEVSGIVASRRHTGLLWVIEDSGNPAHVVGVGLDGTVRATLAPRGASNLDWEAIAIGSDPDGRDAIYVADIGDNFAIRQRVAIYRFAEPDTPADAVVTDVEKIEARYISGPVDAEALIVDADGEIWIISKNVAGPATIYRLDRSSGELRPTGHPLDLGREPVTGADLTADGRALVVRTSRSVRLFPLDAPLSSPRTEVCLAGSPPEPQGEAVAVLPGSGGIVTVSETTGGQGAVVHVLT